MWFVGLRLYKDSNGTSKSQGKKKKAIQVTTYQVDAFFSRATASYFPSANNSISEIPERS